MNFLPRHYLTVILITAVLTILYVPTFSQIPCLSGFVYDPNGNPVVDVDLDFDDAVTGERIYTPGDNTDVLGFYQVCVLPGVYHVSYAPPPGTHLLGKRLYNVELFSSFDLDVTLDFGIVAYGTITDSNGAPVGGVDIDADRISTGERVFTPNDNSGFLTGNYWIVLPPDSYRFRFQPPAGTRWIGYQVDSIGVFSDINLDVTLNEGWLLDGRVTDNLGQGLNNISIDLRDQITGNKIYVANDKTDSTGYYSVAVASGFYNLRFKPLTESRLVGVIIDSLTISSDTTIDQVMTEGVLCSFTVKDSLDNLIEQADIDFIQENTGIKLYLPYDKTDSNGTTFVAVFPDTYIVRVDPPVGSLLDRFEVFGVVIQSDTSFNVVLPEIQTVNLSGNIVNSSNDGLLNIEIILADTLTSISFDISDNITDSLGFFNFEVPRGSFDILFTPPRGSRYRGLILEDITISIDTIWSDVVLDTGLIFRAGVYNSMGLPIENAEFVFTSSSTNEVIYTPHDSTDLSGLAEMTIPSGTYTVRLIPPIGSSYSEEFINNFDISIDTSAEYFLTDASGLLPDKFILKNNYPNPFNQSTLIPYILFESSLVEVDIFNVLGQKVTSINRGVQPPGHYTIVWQGTDSRGTAVVSGVYYYLFKTSFSKKTGSMTLIK